MASAASKKRMNAAELAAAGFAAVVEKLGMADAVRYVQLYQQGDGNYTHERRQWLDQQSHEQIAGLMEKVSKQPPPKRKRGA